MRVLVLRVAPSVPAVRGVAFSPDSKRLASCGGYKGLGEVIVRGAALWESARAAGKEQR